MDIVSNENKTSTENKTSYDKDCDAINVGGVYHFIGRVSNFMYEKPIKRNHISNRSFRDFIHPNFKDDGLADIVEENDSLGINSFIDKSVSYNEVLKGYSLRRVVSFSRILRDGQGKKLLNLLNGFTPCGYCSDGDGSRGMTSEPIGGNSEDMYTFTKQELKD